MYFGLISFKNLRMFWSIASQMLYTREARHQPAIKVIAIFKVRAVYNKKKTRNTSLMIKNRKFY